jgi:hypothetical protein
MSDDDLMPIAKAARAVHMARPRAKAIAIENRIAIRWGGSDAAPRLKVSLSELRAAIRRETYEPPGAQRKPTRASHGGPIHRLVRC